MRKPLTYNRLKLWLRWVALWLCEPKLLWLTVVVIFGAFVIAFGPLCSEPLIRLTGLGLQVLGMLTAIKGIRSTGQLFGRPNLLEAARAWINRFPQYQPRIVGFVASASGGGSAFGRATVSAGIPENPSLEDRIKAAERNIEYLRQDIAGVHQEVDKTKAIFAEAVKAERAERAAALGQLEAQLREAHTGSLHVAAMGTT